MGKEEIGEASKLLFNTLVITSMGITSVVSLIMAMKYITEIYGLTYISNIDSLKYIFKIIGYVSLALMTAKCSDIWYKGNILDINTKFKNNKWNWLVTIIFFIILFFLLWSVTIFIRIT